MNPGVVVHTIEKSQPGLKAGQRALFSTPSMTLLEKPTAFLNHLTRKSTSRATWRNNAYALSYWHNFCGAADVDWEFASIDDLIDYKDALETTISFQTGNRRSDGTVGQYVGAIVDYYEYAAIKEWYSGDIRKVESPRRRTSVDADRLAHIKKGEPPSQPANPIKVGRNVSQAMIKPLSVSELRTLLEKLGPTPTEAPTGTLARNRLIADWGWAVGLRLSEILWLETRQFTNLRLGADAPFLHAQIDVLGKGNKMRAVSVPGWLIEDTQAYIRHERDGCLAAGKRREPTPKLFVRSIESTTPGLPISPRGVESLMAAAYVDAGLYTDLQRTDPETGIKSLIRRPSHCVHDLRHTYAVLTYHAEVAQGNSEPWKKIQVQLGHASLKTTTDIYLEYVHGHNDFRHASLRDLIGLPRR